MITPVGPGLGAAPQSGKALWFSKMSSTVPELHDSTRATDSHDRMDSART